VFPEPIAAVVLDKSGKPVQVTDRDLLTAQPAQVGVNGGAPRPVTAWAGPWPSDERWWDQTRPHCQARLQVLLGQEPAQIALLLAYYENAWTVHAHYD
jgi:protein ImuB